MFCYKLGDEHEGELAIYVQAFRNLFCIGKLMWKRLKSKAVMAAPGPVKHGNVGAQHRHLSSVSFSFEPDVTVSLISLLDLTFIVMKLS
jgi:hypothetical protein